MNDKLTPVAFTASAKFAAANPNDTSGARAFNGVAYGGGVITDHPFFDRVAFDLATTKYAKNNAPVLYGHKDPIGVITEATIGNDIRIGGKVFASRSANAKMVADYADDGFDWEMSVGIWPGQIDEIKAGVKVELNGQKFEGPLTIFRNNRVRETSFVPLGADGSTSARVFNIGGERVAPLITSGDSEMDQAEHDRIVAELNARNTATAAELQSLKDKFAASELARRTDAIKVLFADCGREFKADDDKVKAYLALDDAAFAAVAADLRDAAKKAKPALDPALTKHQATGDPDKGAGGKFETAADYVAEAEKYIAAQAAIGRTVDVADAITHVKRTAAKAA